MKLIPLLITSVILASVQPSSAPGLISPPGSTDVCSYTPTSAEIGIGDVQIFEPNGGDCVGKTATIAPANGTAGFSSGTNCDLTSRTITGAGTVKVRGCQNGNVTLTISDGATVLQTISISVPL